MSKSTLFLMEQIIVITVFALCAAICIRILVESYLMTTNAVDTKNALLAAESAAESHKAFSGDIERIAAVLGGSAEDGRLYVYFDSSWQPGSDIDASFVLRLTRTESAVIVSDIAVSRIACGSELISLTVAARRGS